jgi:adenosine deaminase
MNAAPTAPTPELTAFAHAIPKMELHCHLLGTVRKNTFIELVQRARRR